MSGLDNVGWNTEKEIDFLHGRPNPIQDRDSAGPELTIVFNFELAQSAGGLLNPTLDF